MGLKLLSLILGLTMVSIAAGGYPPLPCCSGDNILTDRGCLETKGSDTYKRHKNLNCLYGMYSVDPTTDESDKFVVSDDGSLQINDGSYVIPRERYCLVKKEVIKTTNESISIAEGTEYVEIAMVCFGSEVGDSLENALTYTVTGSLIITSVVFVILTLIVYFLVSELRDLQGKCIMCMCFCLCLGFFQLGISQLLVHSLNTFCLIIAFSTYFWMLTVFFWMNIVSINVLRSVMCKNSTMSESRIFQIYNLYGWGVPLVFLLAGIIAHHSEGDHIKPGFGDTSCWLTGNLAYWTYFYGPVAAILIINMILFIITSLKLWNTTHYENAGKLRSLKYKFVLYLKLFLVMGISWTFEIMSFIHGKSHVVWMIADTFNCLQGIVFFLVLIVFRKRALRGLAERGLLPQSWIPKGPRHLDEENEDIVGEEETPAMTTP